MKKLMIAAMAVAAGAAFAGTDPITSANVVGYNTLDTGDSTFMMGVPFEDVGGNAEGIRLGDIKGDFDEFDYMEVCFVYFDDDDQDYALGFSDYLYLKKSGVGAWYEEDMTTPANDTRLPLGSAVYFATADQSAKSVTLAGQVRASTFTHPAFDETTEMICSAYPVGFNPNAAEWTGLNEFDYIEVQFVYFDEDDQDYANGFTDFLYLFKGGVGAWYEEDMTTLVTDAITAPGQGFYLCTAVPENVTLTEHSPLEKVAE